MFSQLVPFIKEDNFLKLFNLFEDDGYRVVKAYLEEHAWNDEATRLKESRFIGVGTYRLLFNIYVEYLDSSIEELIIFYERCKRKKDDPHYEDLITTTLFAIVTGILASLLYDFMKKGISSLKNKRGIKEKINKVFEKGVNYILRGRWLRDLLWKKRINKEEHDQLLSLMRQKYLVTSVKTEIIDDNARLNKVESEFQNVAQDHDLKLENLAESIIENLIELSLRMVEFKDLLVEFRKLLKENLHGN